MVVKVVIAVVIAIAVVWFIGSMLCRKKGSSSKQGGAKDDGEAQVYVGNLSFRVRERQLREAFAKFGDIRSLRLIKDRETGRSKGYAFITYQSLKDAKRSHSMHGKDFHGRALVVRSAMRKNQEA